MGMNASPTKSAQENVRSPSGLRRILPAVLACAALITAGGLGCSQPNSPGGVHVGEKEPKHRQLAPGKTTAGNRAEGERDDAHREALAACLELARLNLKFFRRDVDDYTATLVKHERLEGVLGNPQTILCKIRNRKMKDGRIAVPFSIYLRYIDPAEGREVIWVEGRNSGKMVAHDTGVTGLVRVHLATDDYLAMRGNRYPINHLGIQNLLERFIERGQRDKGIPGRELSINLFAELDGRECTSFEVRHPKPLRGREIVCVRVFIDNELRVPIRYTAYGTPSDGEKEPLIEDYYYRDLRLNVGLNDTDFDPDNAAYAFP